MSESSVIDVAYIDHLARSENGFKYLLVAVEAFSTPLRVKPLRSLRSPDTVTAIKNISENEHLHRDDWDKWNEFEGCSTKLCNEPGLTTKTSLDVRPRRLNPNSYSRHSCQNKELLGLPELLNFKTFANKSVTRFTKKSNFGSWHIWMKRWSWFCGNRARRHLTNSQNLKFNMKNVQFT